MKKPMRRWMTAALAVLMVLQLYMPVAAQGATSAGPGVPTPQSAPTSSPQEEGVPPSAPPAQPGSEEAESQDEPGAPSAPPGQSVPASTSPQSDTAPSSQTAQGSSQNEAPASKPPATDAASGSEAPPADESQAQAPLAEGEPQDIKTYFPNPATASIIESINTTYSDNQGNATTQPNIDSLINFIFGVNIPPDIAAQVRAGDYYDIQLPANVSIRRAINNVELYDSDGVLYGHFSVGTNGLVRIVFTDAVETSGGLQGELYFQGNFSRDAIDLPGNHNLTFPTEDGHTIVVNIRPRTGDGITKQGAPNRATSPDTITWNIDFNKTLSTLNNARVEDAFPSSLTPTALAVYSLDIGLQGEVLGETPVPAGNGVYVENPDGSVSFPGQIEGAYRLTYTTAIDPSVVPASGGNISFENTASLTADEISTPLTAASTVRTSFANMLTKVNTGYNPQTQTFSWLVRYNYGLSGEASAFVQDQYDDNPGDGQPITYVDGSAQIYEVSFTSEGTPQRGAPLASPADYTLTDVAGEGRFEIQFAAPRPGQQAYDIVYQTQVPPGFVVADDYSVDNTVSLGGNPPPASPVHSTANVRQQLLHKRLLEANLSTNKLYYEVLINENQYDLYGVSLIDEMGGGHQVEADPDAPTKPLLDIYDLTQNRQLVEGVDYTATLTGDLENPSLFTVIFSPSVYNPLRSTLRLRYSTDFNAVQNPQATLLTNNATLTWSDAPAGTPFEKTDGVDYRPTQPDVENGEKFGNYNAVTKQITWSVLVDYAAIGLRNASFTDPITGNQQFVPGSVRIYEYDINPGSGFATRGRELTEEEYADTIITEPGAANSQTLRVQFPDQAPVPGVETRKFWVDYNTTLEGQQVYSSYENTATLHNDLSDPQPLTGEVAIRHGGRLAEKSGSQGADGYAHWRVLINPSQSMLQNLRVEDVPSANQNILTDSVVVYPGQVDAAGNITPNTGAPLAQGTDYTLEYAQNAAGNWQLTLVFDDGLFPSQNVYVLDYRASLLVASQSETVSNTVNVISTGTEELLPGSNQNIAIEVLNAGGILVGQKTSFAITKTGQGGAPLAGVTFQLYDARGNPVGGVRTTAADGTITWNNLVAGGYSLRELTTLEGYFIPDDLFSGKLYTLAANNQNTDTLQNALARIVVTKYGNNGQPLQGGTFTLQRQEAGSWQEVEAGITPEANGTFTFTGQPVGNYQLLETTAPSGHIRRTAPLAFTVGQNGRLPAVTPVDFYNYQGTATLRKVVQDGAGVTHPLAGGVFSIEETGSPATAVQQTTAAGGTLTFTGLAPGSYTIREVTPPFGFNANPTWEETVIIATETADGRSDANIGDVPNTPYNGGFATIVKEDENGAPLEGATFALARVADENGTPVTPPDNTRSGLVTALNDAGEATAIATGLPPGQYELTETSAPTGYLRNTQTLPFTVVDPPAGDINYVRVGPFVNYQGTARLTKQNEGGQPLPGAVFTLTLQGATPADDVIIGTDYESDINGEVALAGLAPGNYVLAETTAPQGFVRNTTPMPFTIPDEAQAAPAEVDAGTLVNYLGSAVMRKADEAGNALGADIPFTLQRTDGGPPPATAQYTTDAGGEITLQNLAPGAYSLTEDAAPQGFVRNTQPTPFVVPAEAPGAPAPVAVDDFINYRGSILVQKLDDEGVPLAGAVFALAFVDADGGTELLAQYTTDENGQILLPGLAPGNYNLTETNPPEGFLLDPQTHTVAVPTEAEGPPQPAEITLVNRRYLGVLDILKTDTENAPLAGAQFELQDETGAVVRSHIVSATGGQAVVSGLLPGRYTLIETEAPAGYIASPTPHTFTIEYYPVEESEAVLYSTAVAVVNRPAPPPPGSGAPGAGGSPGGPTTGDNLPLLPLLALTTAAFAAAVALVFVRRRRGARGTGRR